MQRRIWSIEEIEGLLLGVNQADNMARSAMPASSEAMRAYRTGFVAALVSVALAVGIRPAGIGSAGRSLDRRQDDA